MADVIAEYRAKFWQKTFELEAHDARVAPLRAERDALNKYLDQARALDDKLRAENARRGPVAQEVAALARACNGKTGERPAKG